MHTPRRKVAAAKRGAWQGGTKAVPARALKERLKDVTRNSILTAAVEEARYDVCITRQLITAIRSARCQKHVPLNSYVSLSKPLSADDDPDRVLMDVLVGSALLDPLEVVIATEQLGDIKAAFHKILSQFEIDVLRLYAESTSYHQIAQVLERDVKSIDNALQRIKRKLDAHLQEQAEAEAEAELAFA